MSAPERGGQPDLVGSGAALPGAHPSRAPAGGVSVRLAEVLTALVLGAVAAIAIYDSQRLGTGWSPDGPRAGYFPFWLGVFLAACSVGNLVAALRATEGEGKGELFVSWGQARLVASVLLPTIVFVVGILVIGIYVSSVLLILWFMVVLGSYSFLRSIPTALAITAAIFVVFELWFLVALPKGPLEAALGY